MDKSVLLPFGSFGLAHKKLQLLRNDFDTWESTTIAADFPEGAS
jgi:hypothetical protein